MSYLQSMNPSQRSAVCHSGGPVQVLAGPGSGKTFTIVKRLQYLIEVQKISPESILVITFTKAAAKEMQSRFLREIRHSYSAVNFGTFHSVYYQILSRSGYFQDYSLVSEAEKKKIIIGIMQRNFSTPHLDPMECTEILNEISRIKNQETVEEVPESDNRNDKRKDNRNDNRKDNSHAIENIMEIYEEYCDMLKSLRKLDFDDMIRCCYDMLISNPRLLQKWQGFFSHLLVDEFQDINRLQYQVLKLLAAPDNHIFGVGDDDQSIYAFRGASPTVMQEFLNDYPDGRQIFLDINYRSTRPIVLAADKVISCNRQRIAKQGKALKDGSEVIVRSFTDKEKEYDFLMQEIQSLPAEVRKESAVILRTNYEVSLVAAKCAEKGIDVHSTEKAKDVFNHFIADDIMDYIRFACQEKTRGRYLNIINKPVRYISRKSVANMEGLIEERKVLEFYRENIDGRSEIRRFFADCDRIARMPPFLAVHYIRKGIGYDRYLKERARPGEYEEWMEIAAAVQESTRNCPAFEAWFGLIEQIRSMNQRTKQPEHNKNGSKGIRLITMHSAKGLEFHTVFLPHLNEGILPGRKSLTAEQIEEERRLFYVGMTRAKEKLWLLYTASPKDIPSRFLAPLL